MPQLAAANLPEWAERAYVAVGYRPGLAVLAVLANRDEAVPHRDLAQAAGLSVQTTSDALRRLEDAGLVEGSIPRPQRPGPGVRWSLNRDALAVVLHELTDGLHIEPRRH